MASHLVLSYCK